MSTIENNLQIISNCKEDIRQAIENKGVGIPPATPLVQYASKVSAIAQGGGGCVSDGWQPHPDWWDIEQIFKDDPDPNKRCIVLFSDTVDVYNFNFGNNSGYYKTSDGKTINYNGNWTADLSKDKSGKPFATRYAIFYSTNVNLSFNIATSFIFYHALYIYIGNNSVPTFSLGAKAAYSPHLPYFEAVKMDATVVLNSGFYGANAFLNTGLQYINRLPPVTIPDMSLNNTSLGELTVPKNSFYVQSFSNVRTLKKLILNHPLRDYFNPYNYVVPTLSDMSIVCVETQEDPIQFPEYNVSFPHDWRLDLVGIQSYQSVLEICNRLEPAPPPVIIEDDIDPNMPPVVVTPTVRCNFANRPYLAQLLADKGYECYS
ncbi:MAG: hypothetical protein LBI45_05360 [Bacteroidales bacterium]|jgi:hypothetical protein|nr:hypothetical protein [Bacteroidales bacterium]